MLSLLLSLLLQADDARALIEKLRSDKPAERSDAADKLKDLGRAAVPALEEAARSPNRELAEQAKYLLKVVPVREKLSSIIFDLMPGVEERLATGGAEAWAAVLAETLLKDKDGDPYHTSLRKTDLEALATEAVAAVQDPYKRAVALQLVIDWKLRGALPAVARVLEDPDPKMRAQALRVIGRLVAREYVNDVRARLKDGDPEVCGQAIAAVRLIRPWDGAQEDIAPMLADLRPNVRGMALQSLREMRAYGKAWDVLPLLKDVDLNLRASAAMALGELGMDPAKIAPLLKDGNAGVRKAALWALGVLDAKGTAPDVARLLFDADPSVRAGAAEAFGRMQVKDPLLLDLLQDPEDDVRFRAAWTLGELAYGEAELRKAVKSNRILPAASAAYALGRMGVADAIPDIVRLTRPGLDPTSRWMAVTALGGVGGADELRKLLDDPQGSVRWAAAQSLGRLNEDADYAKLLKDPEPMVRMWAGLALARRGLKDGVDAVWEAAPKCSTRSLLWLNRLHAQEVWNRLENTGIDEALEGTADEILEKMALKTKLMVGRIPHAYRYQPRYRIPAGTNWLDALDRLQFWSQSEYVMDSQATRSRFEVLFGDRGFEVTSTAGVIANHKLRIERAQKK